MTSQHHHIDADRVFALVGAGGLGGPIACALAAAGARRLLICDDDAVELSNLQRQIQFTTADVGVAKVEALTTELVRRGYPRERIEPHKTRVDADNLASIIAGADVVIDGSDNFATKFAVNDTCVALGKPCVIGGVLRYGGQVASIIPGQGGCYRCLFEAPPDDGPTCADAGVLGASVAVIAGYAAAAALRLRRSDESMVLVVDDVRDRPSPRELTYHPRPDCSACFGARPARQKEAS